MKQRGFFALIRGGTTVVMLGTACWAAQACVGSPSCFDRGYCPDIPTPDGGAGTSTGGTAGHSGVGGNASGGSTNGGSAGAGNAGTSAGEAGAAGAADACGNSCHGAKPACKSDGTCVECTESAHCTAPKPVCNTASSACVECVGSPDCKAASKPLCDTKTHACVACITDSDCKSADAARCDGGACKACNDNTQCKHVAGKGVCDIGPGQCVQCTGTNYSGCSKDKDSNQLVCDSLKRTCTTAAIEHGVGQCEACVSDANCKLGQLCVLDRFNSKNLGYFCHWKQGDTTDGAPADCATAGRPFAGVQAAAVSIDGQTADICLLRVSTCVANNQFSDKDCKSGSTGNDSLCGADAPNDAKCVPFGVGFRCTMRCLGDDDCPDPSTCDKTATPRVCKLN